MTRYAALDELDGVELLAYGNAVIGSRVEVSDQLSALAEDQRTIYTCGRRKRAHEFEVSMNEPARITPDILIEEIPDERSFSGRPLCLLHPRENVVLEIRPALGDGLNAAHRGSVTVGGVSVRAARGGVMRPDT